MRVLILLEAGPPTPYWAAGITQLIETGIEPVLATIHPRGPLHELVEGAGGSAIALDVTRARRYGSAIRRLRAEIRRLDPDLVHASEPVAGFVGGVAAWRLVPAVFHRHHIMIEGRSPALRAMAGVAKRSAAATLAVSRAVGSQAKKEGCDFVHVAENGLPDLRPVSASEVEVLRSQLSLRPTTRLVVFVSRLRRVKGQDVVLMATEKLAARGQDVALVVVGDGPERQRLQETVAARHLESLVRVVGHQSDVAPWYALADVVAVPSLMEPFGLVAVEAMQAAKPVVASAVGGLKDIVAHGTTGHVVPPGDAEALADALGDLLQHPEKAREFGDNGRARYESWYTLRAMVDGWIECYHDVLHRSGPAADVTAR